MSTVMIIRSQSGVKQKRVRHDVAIIVTIMRKNNFIKTSMRVRPLPPKQIC